MFGSIECDDGCRCNKNSARSVIAATYASTSPPSLFTVCSLMISRCACFHSRRIDLWFGSVPPADGVEGEGAPAVLFDGVSSAEATDLVTAANDNPDEVEAEAAAVCCF